MGRVHANSSTNHEANKDRSVLNMEMLWLMEDTLSRSKYNKIVLGGKIQLEEQCSEQSESTRHTPDSRVA